MHAEETDGVGRTTLVFRSRTMTKVRMMVTVMQRLWTPRGMPRRRGSYSVIQAGSWVQSESKQTGSQLGQLTGGPISPDSSFSTYAFSSSTPSSLLWSAADPEAFDIFVNPALSRLWGQTQR